MDASDAQYLRWAWDESVAFVRERKEARENLSQFGVRK